jgi:hypothetical protein
MSTRPLWLKGNAWWILLLLGFGFATFTDHMGWTDFDYQDNCCPCEQEHESDA